MSTIEDIRRLALRHARPGTSGDTALARLKIYTLDQPTNLMPLIYDPVVCLVLQGAKRTVIGNRACDYGEGDCMVVAAEVTAMGQINRASAEEPYLAANLYLDPEVIASLLIDLSGMPEPSCPPGFDVSKASPPLLDVWRRLIELLDRPEEIPLLGNRLEQEVLLRMLIGTQGILLRQLASPDSRLAHVRRAMEWIRSRYAERLMIEDMASVAGMSVSVFHRRFKAVTGQSPLQYQKQIRLNEARHQILTKGANAASAALAVGYESSSQFSREYKRMFGEPPRRDAAAIKSMLSEGILAA